MLRTQPEDPIEPEPTHLESNLITIRPPHHPEFQATISWQERVQ